MSAARLYSLDRERSAKMILVPGGAHQLFVNLGHVEGMFSRDKVRQLGEALATVPARHALTLMQAFAPGVRSEADISALLNAFEAFNERMGEEDRRDRVSKSTKPIWGL